MQAAESSSPERAKLPRFLHDPLVFGSLCGLASALGYTAANACLRAVSDCDAVWVSCVKAFPTVAMFGPLLVYGLWRGREFVPPRRQLLVLIAAALVCQLLGNVVFQWSLGVVGIALTVPLTLGTMIISGAVMGRMFLLEPVTFRMAISTCVLIAAIAVLSLGAGDASRSVAGTAVSPTLWLVVAGVLAACLSGVAYAMLGVVIRHSVTARMSIPMTMVTVTLTGLVALGAMSLMRIGVSGVLATPPRDFWVMMLAGFFNAIAFLALTKSLQLIPVIYVNALNATQATMAAVAGVLIFAESSSPALWIGVALTVGGLLLMQRRTRAKNAVSMTAGPGKVAEDGVPRLPPAPEPVKT